MRFVNQRYPLSELTCDVIAGFYRSYDAFGFGFLEPVHRRVLSLELRHAGLAVQSEVPFELFHLSAAIGRSTYLVLLEQSSKRRRSQAKQRRSLLAQFCKRRRRS